MLSYKFKNGSVVNGTLEQILEIGKLLGEKVEGISEIPKGYYHSDSKGIVQIKDMNEVHIKNAINKIAYNYYHSLGKEDIELDEYLRKFVALATQPKLQELFSELQRRTLKPAK